MKTSPQDNTLQFLSSMDTNHLAIDTKLAILSFHNQPYSWITEVAIILIEYFQLASQAFLFNLSLYPASDEEHPLLKLIIGASKLVYPGSFLLHQSQNTYNVFVAIVLGLLVLKYALTVCVCIFAAKSKGEQKGFLIGLWRWIFKLQGRVIYLLISSVLMQAMLAALNDEVRVFGRTKPGIISFSMVIIIIEFIFSLALQLKFCCVFPTKSILSAKDSVLETSTLTQKFIAQVLQLIFSSMSQYAWIVVIVNLLLSLSRLAYFFRILPLYNIKVFLYQGALIAIVITANLACLVQTIANAATDEENIDIYYILILWIIISLFAIKIVDGCLHHYILLLTKRPSYMSSKLLLHKVHGLKQLLKITQTQGAEISNNWSDLLNATMTFNAKRILSLDLRLFDDDAEDSIGKMSIHYLEDLSNKFPKSDLIRLYIIYYYAIKMKNYGVALKLINDLKQNSSKLLLLNASLILNDIRNMEIFKNRDEENKLDFSVYIKNVSAIAKWKCYMLGQVDRQMSLCEETMAETPDLAKIFTIAQKMYYYRHAADKKSRMVFNSIPSYYIEPYMIYAHYQLVVNHSVAEYREYVRHHYKKYKQYDKYFKNNNVMPENIYHNTGFMILSAQKGNMGKILFYTKGITDIYGGDARRYIGSDVGIFGPPATRTFYKDFLDQQTRDTRTRVFRGFAQHKEGYIFELDFCLNVYLFESQGLCFTLINRKVMSEKDYLLVHENGEIEGVSRKLGRRLGLFHKEESMLPKINISSISKELGRANEAFNIITLPEKYKPNETKAKSEENESIHQYDMNLEEATNLHAIFSSEGKEIVIKIPSEIVAHTDSYTYSCTITTTDYGSMQLKTFILEETEIDMENFKFVSPAKTKVKGNKNTMDTREKDLPSPNEKGPKITDVASVEDEKQSGWIDLSPFESGRRPRLLPLLTENNKVLTSARTQEDFLLSPSSKRLLSPMNQLTRNVSSTTGSKQNNNLFKHIKSSDGVSKTATVEDEEESEGSESDIIKPEVSVAASQMSQSSHSDATLKAYRTALLHNTTPVIFKVTFFFFYLLLVLLFGSQLKLKYDLDDFLNVLDLKKNILGDSSNRDTAVASIHGNANSLWPAGVRVAAGENSTSLNSTIARYQTFVAQQLALVDASNHALLVDMQYLDEDTRKYFFEKDVTIYDTFFDAPQQVFMDYTNFGAIDRIVETGAEALRKSRAGDYVTSKADFFFLFRNPENDLLVKSQELGSILDQSLTNEREAAEKTTIDYLITTLVLLGVIAVALYVLIWKQYLTERNNLLAFAKLDTQSIQTVHSRLVEFKYKIENEKSFEKTTIDLAEYLQPSMKSKNAKVITVHKRHLQDANYWGIFRKYLFHTLKLTIFIFIFMGLVLWSNISAKVSIDYFHNKQVQLRLSGQMKFITTLAAVVSEELLTRNNASQILNQWTANLSPSNLDGLVTLRADLAAAFLNDDGQYNRVIADILVGSGRCDLLPSDGQTYCKTLSANGILLNYMNVLINFEKLLRNRYNLFIQLAPASRTTTALTSIRNINSGLFRPLRLILEYQSNVIFSIINTAFEQDLKDVAHQRNIIFAIIAVSLFAVSVVAWFSLLRILKEANNQFKKVLQSLPAHIVLQSFLLRLFLMGNSMISLKNE